VADIIKDKDRWVDFMMRYELNLEKPDPKRATQSAFNIGVSYIVGGLVPLSPYIFIKDAHMALYMSVIVTLISLYIFGFFKSKMTGVNPWWGAFRVMLIGAAAAAAAFGIAQAFGRG
jgi:predicted membrane protein (TIGR00267 family)